MKVLKTLPIVLSLLVTNLPSNAVAANNCFKSKYTALGECVLWSTGPDKVCLKTRRYTEKEKLEIIKEKEEKHNTCLKNQKEQLKRDIIFDNCVIAKSKGQLKVVQGSIRNSCKAISENPSWFQKLKWGG